MNFKVKVFRNILVNFERIMCHVLEEFSGGNFAHINFWNQGLWTSFPHARKYSTSKSIEIHFDDIFSWILQKEGLHHDTLKTIKAVEREILQTCKIGSR